MEAVVEPRNMRQAWKRVRANKGSAGVDGMTVDEVPAYLQRHWPAIRAQLLAGSYTPPPVRRVGIPKPDGGVRQWGIPTVVDRLIQQALLQVLEPLYDRSFSRSIECLALAEDRYANTLFRTRFPACAPKPKSQFR